MRTIILIGHKKRQGKDTLAAMLSEITGGEILSFADPMKEIIADTFNVPMGELEEAKNNELRVRHEVRGGRYKQTYREVLQRFGTEAMKKQFGEDVWGKLAVDKIRGSSSDVIIIPGFRFNVEYATLRSELPNDRIVTVNIVRDEQHYDTHTSETALDGFDYDHVIPNNRGLEHLQSCANLLWDVIKG